MSVLDESPSQIKSNFFITFFLLMKKLNVRNKVILRTIKKSLEIFKKLFLKINFFFQYCNF